MTRWFQRVRNVLHWIGNYIIQNDDRVFLFSLTIPPILVGAVNVIQNVSLYDNTILSIAGYQAIITAYLSLKIYTVSKRDSELPELYWALERVEETDTPWEGYVAVACYYKITNLSHGRAKIRDVTVSDLSMLPDAEPEPGEQINVGFPAPKGVPAILDKNESVTLHVQVNGLSYIDNITLTIDEMSLGEQERELMLSEISNQLMFARHNERGN